MYWATCSGSVMACHTRSGDAAISTFAVATCPDIRFLPFRSEPTVPEADRVVDPSSLVLGENPLGGGLGELDAHDRLEVLARVELPPDHEPLARPALTPPEPLHRQGVVGGVGAGQPPAERRARGVIVDDVCRSAGS